MPVKALHLEDINVVADEGLKVNYAENINFINLDLTSKGELE